MSSRLPEILLIDKPTGMTSFDVIRQLRKSTGITKFGHAGTLDPAATGLLIIGVEDGTKQLTQYIKLDKEYVAEILIGRSTTTGDIEGQTLEEVSEVTEVSQTQIINALHHMTGNLRLPVSAYSAIKKDGVPMYKRAREAAKIGDLVKEVPIRDMKVYQAEFLSLGTKSKQTGWPLVKVRFKVGSGTYIRSLAEELGRRLGYPASLYSLRRTKIGDFTIENARHLTDF